MVKNVKISRFQLALLIIGFIFGSSAIFNPGAAAYQDAWLAYIIGWVGGYILIGIYVFIAMLYPSKNLIEILKDIFGKYLGSLIGVFYVFYFIHLAALVLRNFGEFIVSVNYPETPILFILICLTCVSAYALKSGLEVIARLFQIFVPLLIFLVVFLFIIHVGLYEPKHLLPFLERGFTPVIKTGFSYVTFPFGESVVFLMIFPYINDKDKLSKTTFVAVTIVGSLLFSITLRDLLLLGPDKFARNLFPPNTSTGLIPGIVVTPFISVNLLVGSGVQIMICLSSALVGITQLFNLDDYKIFVLPLGAILVSLAIWLHNNLSDMIRWSGEIYPYYATPFQIIIPLLILVISLFKKKKTKRKTLN